MQNFNFVLTPPVGSVPKVYTEDLKLCAYLLDAQSVQFEDEQITKDSGKEILKFRISRASPYYKEVQAERLVDFGGRWFRIKLVEESYPKDSNLTVSCNALWYELAEGPLKELKLSNSTPYWALHQIFSDVTVPYVGWRISESAGNPGIYYTENERNSNLFHLKRIFDKYNLELSFGYEVSENRVRIVVLVQSYVESKLEEALEVGKHINKVLRTVDSRELCTRYSIIGADDEGNEVTIAPINGGKYYLDNASYFTSRGLPARIIEKKKTDGRWSNLQNMKDEMRSYLAKYSRPFITYEVNASIYPGNSIPNLLDSQLIIDNDYSVAEWRIVSARKLNYSKIESSSLKFEDPRKNLVTEAVQIKRFKNEVKSAIRKNGKQLVKLAERISVLERKK